MNKLLRVTTASHSKGSALKTRCIYIVTITNYVMIEDPYPVSIPLRLHYLP